MATVVEVAGGGVFPQLLELAYRGWAFDGVGPGWAAHPAFVKGSPRCRRPSQPCRVTARRAGRDGPSPALDRDGSLARHL